MFGLYSKTTSKKKAIIKIKEGEPLDRASQELLKCIKVITDIQLNIPQSVIGQSEAEILQSSLDSVKNQLPLYSDRIRIKVLNSSSDEKTLKEEEAIQKNSSRI